MTIIIMMFLLCLHMLAQSKTVDPSEKQAVGNAAYSLLLPGKTLYLSVLLSQTKFKSRGNKAGALAGWKLLETSGLAKVVEVRAQRGTDKVNRHILYMFLYNFVELSTLWV